MLNKYPQVSAFFDKDAWNIDEDFRNGEIVSIGTGQERGCDLRIKTFFCITIKNNSGEEKQFKLYHKT